MDVPILDISYKWINTCELFGNITPVFKVHFPCSIAWINIPFILFHYDIPLYGIYCMNISLFDGLKLFFTFQYCKWKNIWTFIYEFLWTDICISLGCIFEGEWMDHRLTMFYFWGTTRILSSCVWLFMTPRGCCLPGSSVQGFPRQD